MAQGSHFFKLADDSYTQDKLSYPEIDEDPKNIIACCDKGTCCNGRINTPFVKKQRGKSTYNACHYNNCNEGYGYCQGCWKITFPKPGEG